MRKITVLASAALLGLSLTLGACDGLMAPSKADILEKIEGAETKAQIRDALGDPDDVSKFGPVETWTYGADTGAVKVDFAGDKVLATRTVDDEE